MPQIVCPRCQTAQPYFEELAGKTVFCLGCGIHFVVPRVEGDRCDPLFEAATITFPAPADSEPPDQGSK